MKIDLKSWKRISDHPDHTILRNHEGHELKIAKKPLSKKAREQLALVPHHVEQAEKPMMYNGGQAGQMPVDTEHMADGGQIEADDMDPQSAAAIPGFRTIGEQIDKLPQSNIVEMGARAAKGDDEALKQLAEGSASAVAGSLGPIEEAGGLMLKARQMFPHAKSMEELSQIAHENLRTDHPILEALRQASNRAMDLKKVHGMADGGEISAKPGPRTEAAMKSIRTAFGGDKDDKKDTQHKAQGGEIKKDKQPGDNMQAAMASMRGAFKADGGEIKANPNQQAAFKSIRDAFNKPQNKAEGGEIEDQKLPININVNTAPQANAPDLSPQAVQQAQQAVAAQGQPANMQQPAVVPQSNDVSSQLQPAPASQPDQSMPAQSSDIEQPSVAGGYKAQQAGILGQGEAESAQTEAEADTMRAQIGAYQKIGQAFQDHLAQNENERKALIKDINEGHIDPNRYLGSMDTGNRILASIAVGLGAQAGDGRNPALDLINKNIDRDIAAQQSDIDKKKTLLSANLQHFGDLRQATEMTRVMMNDMTIDKLKLAAAQTQSPIIKAKQLQLAGQLEQQSAPMIQQIAMRQALLSHPSDELDPAQLVPYLPASEQEKKEIFKEVANAQEVNKLRNDMKSSFNDLQKLSLNGLFSPRERSSAVQAFAGRLAKVAEGRFNLQEAELQAKSLLPQPGDATSTIANKAKRVDQLFDTMINAPTARAYGIDLNQFKSTKADPYARLDQQQKSFVDWAKKNPNDPRSAMVLKKLGIQ